MKKKRALVTPKHAYAQYDCTPACTLSQPDLRNWAEQLRSCSLPMVRHAVTPAAALTSFSCVVAGGRDGTVLFVFALNAYNEKPGGAFTPRDSPLENGTVVHYEKGPQ